MVLVYLSKSYFWDRECSLKAYVVSLEQDLQRRRHVCKQLKDIGLKAEIFYGIDGRTLTSEQVISLQHSNVRHLSGYQGELSKSETMKWELNLHGKNSKSETKKWGD